MTAQRGQVVWTATPQPTLAQTYGLSSVEYTAAGEPDDLDHEDGEAVVSRFPEVALILGDNHDQGAGSLCITNRRICWQDSGRPQSGFAAGFTDVGLHAIANESPGYNKPCIYLQLATDAEPSFESDDAQAQAVSRDLRFVPAASDSLQEIFRILCECAALNPDPDQAEGDEDGDMFYDEDEVLAGSGAETRAAMLDHYDSLLQMPRGADLDELLAEDPERFEDPDGLDQLGDPDGSDQRGDSDGLDDQQDSDMQAPVPYVPTPHVPRPQ